MQYTEFERDLINWFIVHSPHSAVTDQLLAAELVSREYTGAGLYLDVAVPDTGVGPIPSSVKSPISGPEIAGPTIPNGAGSLLFLDKAIVSIVEVFTYTDELFNDITEYRFHEREK